MKELIERFYTAFAAGDVETMASCYHEDARFSDPVFPDLDGKDEVMKMWRTLVGRSDDINIVLGDHAADDRGGTAHWTATYTFTTTGRPVVNEIDAAMVFRDGLIVDHKDSFDFWKWSRQALGTPGLLLGWSPILKKKVRAQSAQLLQDSTA